MRVFLSWSKPRSKAIASALHEWLPLVLQDVEPWMSSKDIDAGRRWSEEIATNLAACNFGILCVTPENLDEPWLHFEGGALAKHMASTTPSAEKVDSKVVPYLYNLEPEHLGTRPLAGLQGKRANKDDTYEMLTSINKSKEKPLPEARLRTGFDKFWPELEAKLRPEALGAGGAPTPPRPNADELLAELVVIVRDQAASIDVVREQIAQVRAAVEPRNFGLLGTGVATPGEKPALASLFQDADLDGFEKYLARRQLKGIARDVVKRINEAEGAEVLPRLREEYLRAKQEEGQQDGEKEPPPKKPRK